MVEEFPLQKEGQIGGEEVEKRNVLVKLERLNPVIRRKHFNIRDPFLPG